MSKPYSPRLIHTAAVWGVAQRHRYFIDGRRVSEREFDLAYAEAGYRASDSTTTRTASLTRNVWERKA